MHIITVRQSLCGLCLASAGFAPAAAQNPVAPRRTDAATLVHERPPATPTVARRASNASRAHVGIVVVPTLPYANATAVVVRRPDATPLNLILLSEDASAESLVAAYAVLDKSRSLHGDFPEQHLRIRVPVPDGLRRLPPGVLARFGAEIAQARAVSETEIDGIGRGRLLIARLPRTPRTP